MKKMQALKRKKGFTLIEIIVVLVILAILVAVSLPTMFGYIEEARAKSRVQEARVGLLAAQWVVSEFAMTIEQVNVGEGDAATTSRAIAVDNVLKALNREAVSDDAFPGSLTAARIRTAFETKVEGVREPQLAATEGAEGFSAVELAGASEDARVAGITYNDGLYTIQIVGGTTLVEKN